MRLAIIFTIVLAMTACGAEQPNSATDDGSASVDERATPESKSRVAESALTNTPISFADATGETSQIIDVDPCPFVSDEKITASVRSEFEITRREVSNTQCRWAYNAGFAIEVTIEDVVSAKPVSERRYNMDVATVLSSQDGPGTNAVVVNDTAWDKQVPFAFSFEQDEKLVFMRYTGFKTNAEIMRPAADEISARMGSAPEIESQRRHATEPFQACETWNDQDMKSVFSLDDNAVIGQGMSGMSTCTWDIYEDGVSGKKTAGFSFTKFEPGKTPDYGALGYSTYSDNGEEHYFEKRESDYGTFILVVTVRPEGVVGVTLSDPTGDQTDAAKILQANLLSRLVQ